MKSAYFCDFYCAFVIFSFSLFNIKHCLLFNKSTLYVMRTKAWLYMQHTKKCLSIRLALGLRRILKCTLSYLHSFLDLFIICWLLSGLITEFKTKSTNLVGLKKCSIFKPLLKYMFHNLRLYVLHNILF